MARDRIELPTPAFSVLLAGGRLPAVLRLARVEARLPVIVVQADCCLPGKLVDLSLKLSKPSIDENKTNPGDHRG